MTKSDLIERLRETLKLPKGKAELIVNVIFDSMEESLQRGERIEIRGFGSFEIRNYKAYEGRNPRTGDPVDVQPKRLPFFKVGKELKERVNGGASPSREGARYQRAVGCDRRRRAASSTQASTGPVAASGDRAAALGRRQRQTRATA